MREAHTLNIELLNLEPSNTYVHCLHSGGLAHRFVSRVNNAGSAQVSNLPLLPIQFGDVAALVDLFDQARIHRIFGQHKFRFLRSD